MKGLDISFSKPSAQWWVDRRAEGFEAAVQCVWTGGFASNDGIKAVAETNLRNARLAGFRVAAYANASPPDWWPLVTQMTHIRANMGGEWDRVKDVVIDVEISGITKARVMELADGLEAVGKIADVLYTARWFWTGHMGNTKEIAWRRFRLWSAHYDWNPDIDFGDNPYGPWPLAEVIGEQYQGSTNVAGGTIDLNTFKDSWMAPEKEDEMLKLIKKASSGTVYATDGIYKWGIPTMTLLREMKEKGLATGDIQTVSDRLFARITTRPRHAPLTAAETQSEVKKAVAGIEVAGRTDDRFKALVKQSLKEGTG